MLKLSIIVPAYNVEPYIERCLRSLIEQDIPEEDYEIIVVNDGSPDNSREIVLRLQSEFKNLILIDQENMGVSAARNTAIERANGKYILAIDPDDYVEMNSLASLIKKVDDEQLDVLYLGFETYDYNGHYLGKNNYQHLEGKIFTGIEAYHATRGKKMNTPDRSCGILYNSSFLNKFNLLYTVDIPYLEDGLFVGKVLCFTKRCAFIDKPFYKYVVRPDSASNNNHFISNKTLKGFIKAAIDIRGFENKESTDNEQKGLINHLTAKFVLTAIMASIGTRKISAIIKVKKIIPSNGLNVLNMSGLFETKTYVRIYNLSFWLFVIYFILDTRWKRLKIWLKRKY